MRTFCHTSTGARGLTSRMARLARIVVPNVPHHVTQRGNRREPIFFEDGDQDVYRDLLAEHCQKNSVEVWAYCFMPNHVHLIAVPRHQGGLARAIGDAHRRYTTFVNARGGWHGHLFQERFASVAMDEDHLIAAARYVSLNPVRARLVARAEDWPWASTRAHLYELNSVTLTAFSEMVAYRGSADKSKNITQIAGM